MNYALLVLSPAHSSQGARSALLFARAAVARGHKIERVFFYGDAVHAASALIVAPQDEVDLTSEWATLVADNGTELLVCVGASLRRGLLDETEAKRYSKSQYNLHPAFEIAGLGQLVEASQTCDRLITFS